MARKSGTSPASPPCAPGCAARRAGLAGARRLVASVLFVLVAVTHVLVPQEQHAVSAFVAADAVDEPQAGGEVLQGAAQQGPGADGVDLAGHRETAQGIGVGQTSGVGVTDQVRDRVGAQQSIVDGQTAGRMQGGQLPVGALTADLLDHAEERPTIGAVEGLRAHARTVERRPGQEAVICVSTAL